MEEHGVPGVALGVLFDGEEETAGLGVTSIENPLEVTPDTLFQIGSIGKAFTATAVMRLVEEGKRDLDAPVRDYLPDFRPKSVAEMVRPQVDVGGNIDAIGLAWMLMSIEDVRLIGHGGGTKGQISWLAVAPEQKFALAVVTNHQRGGVVADRVAEAAYEAYLGVREPEQVAIDLPRERLQEYLGRYEARMSDLVLADTNHGLEVRLEPKAGFPTPETPPSPPPPPIPVAFSSENEIFVPEGMFKGDRAVFLRDAEGRIAWLRVGGRVYAPAGR